MDGIVNELDHLSKVIRENDKIREEQTDTMIEVAREIKTEIANLAGCLNELLWQIRSDRQTGKACGCSKHGAL